MTISPDQSRFTACVIGEATPEEQAIFDAALLKDASLRGEAVTLSRTAHRLAGALLQEENFALTPAQRHAVFQAGAPQAAAPARPAVRPAWFGPTLATGGIAALLALGFYALPVFRSSPSLTPEETGIPAVALRPATVVKPGPAPIAPPPLLTKDTVPAVLPDPAAPTGPAASARPRTMAAVPPVITIGPAPVPPAGNAVRNTPPASNSKTGPEDLEGSLASPAPRRP